MVYTTYIRSYLDPSSPTSKGPLLSGHGVIKQRHSPMLLHTYSVGELENVGRGRRWAIVRHEYVAATSSPSARPRFIRGFSSSHASVHPKDKRANTRSLRFNKPREQTVVSVEQGT